MRCLQHVLWRGAMALALLGGAGVGALALPQPPAPLPARADDVGTPRQRLPALPLATRAPADALPRCCNAS